MKNVYILLDRSGSMETKWSEAIGSINGYVEALKGEDINIFLAAFDSSGLYGSGEMSYEVLRNVTLPRWTKLSPSELTPRGGTPLRDAAARMINRILEDNAERSVMIVMTDGEENTSKDTTADQLNRLVDRVKGKGYELVFLGADFNKVGETASSFGIHDKGKFVHSSVRSLNATMQATAEKSQQYFTSGAAMSYSDEEKVKAAS